MKKKQSVNKLRIIGVVFVAAMLFSIGSDVVTTIKTKYEIKQAQQENDKLKKESADLKNEVSKLKDENYIQSYASGIIFSTEKGTEVYILPKDKAPE